MKSALTDSDKKVLAGANYVHTTSPKFKKNEAIDYNGLVHRFSNTSLISLIYGMTQSEFGFNTIRKVMIDIDKYNNMHMPNKSGATYLDSGGYSIIAGDCASNDALKLINCYAHALTHYGKRQDRILSLDVPFFINEPNKCTRKNIYDMNVLSAIDTIKAVEKNPYLKNRLMFIQQFKMLGQYEIFNKIYNEYKMWKYMDHYAIGGLVGLGAATSINFAPFIGPLFQAFNRYLNHPTDTKLFNCHILGQYHLHARFILIFAEYLFKSLDTVNNCKITYDSINYLITSQFKIKAEHKYVRVNDDLSIVHYRNLIELDRDELVNAYPDSVLESVHSELDIIKSGSGNVKDVSFAVPLYAYSQLQIDQLFHKLIVKYNMVEIFKNSRNIKTLTNQFNAIINSIHSDYSNVLGAYFTKKLLLNVHLCYAFYSGWYVNDRTDIKIDELMRKFIKKIDFPADLTS